MPKLIAIVAMSPNRGIGLAGKLPWHYPEDLAWFKEKTMGQTLLMGRTTFEGLPKKLQGRNILVYTRQADYPNAITDLAQLEQRSEDQIWICGGAQVYEKTFPMCDEVYLTKLRQNPEAVDTYLAEFETGFQAPTLVRETPDFEIWHYKKI